MSLISPQFSEKDGSSTSALKVVYNNNYTRLTYFRSLHLTPCKFQRLEIDYSCIIDESIHMFFKNMVVGSNINAINRPAEFSIFTSMSLSKNVNGATIISDCAVLEENK